MEITDFHVCAQKFEKFLANGSSASSARAHSRCTFLDHGVSHGEAEGGARDAVGEAREGEFGAAFQMLCKILGNIVASPLPPCGLHAKSLEFSDQFTRHTFYKFC